MCIPSVHDHFGTTLSNNNFRFQFVRESGEYIFEFEATSGGPCRELVFDFESPPVNAACALLLLLVMAEAEAAAVADASRTRPGGSHWRTWSSFRFSPSKPL